MRYMLWVVALLGACDVIQEGHHFWRHLGFYRKLEIDAGHVECDMVKHYVAFC